MFIWHDECMDKKLLMRSSELFLKKPDILIEAMPFIRQLEKASIVIKYGGEALGSDIKEPSESEKKNISIARKSIHLNSDFKAGHILSEYDFIMMRPGDGIAPMKYKEVVGRELKINSSFQHKLSEEDLI